MAGRRRWHKGVAALLVAAFAVVTLLFLWSLNVIVALGSFYVASAEEIAAGPPGSIIRKEPLSFGLLVDADAWRVLYRSTGLHGEGIAVSGMVIVPRGLPPAGGRPIVGWAHPTSGVVPRCAPSLALLRFQQIQGLRALIEGGAIVAATDYPGLGTPGPHPYLIGRSEAYAVLNSLRAARSIAGSGASQDVALWGHSQGGQAVLHAGAAMAAYAPELRLAGVAAAAPATDLKVLVDEDIASTGGKNLLAMTLWSWQRVFGAPLNEVVMRDADDTVERLAADCLETPLDIRRRLKLGRLLERAFLKVPDVTNLDPWRTLLTENAAPLLPPAMPVFVAQGLDDTLVRPAVTRSYVDLLCGAGSSVRYVGVPGTGHGLIGRESAPAATAWIADRLAGRPPPDDCAARPDG